MRPDLRLVTAREGALANTSPVRVVLADDHEPMRRRIRAVLKSSPDIELVAEAGDLEAAIRHVERHSPDVLVLDLQLLGFDVVALIRRLREEAPNTEIVVLTMDARAAVAAEVLEAGAIAYVLKEHADVDLPIALRRALKGARFVTAQVDAHLRALSEICGPDGLTQRELEVLRLTALGFTCAEIANRLHISVRTTEHDRAAVHRKLAIRTRVELVAYALDHGLMEP